VASSVFRYVEGAIRLKIGNLTKLKTLGGKLKKLLVGVLVTTLTLGLGSVPASAAACTANEKKVVRSLLVPVTEMSLNLGTDLKANASVRKKIKSIRKNSTSKSLRLALLRLDGMIQVGEMRPGINVFWSGGKNSVLDMYRKARKITEKGKC